MVVYVAIEDKNKNLKIYKSRDYQELSYNIFIKNKSIKKIKFHFENDIIFSLNNFESPHLQEKYPRCCELKTDLGNTYILSDNKNIIQKYVYDHNRYIYRL